MKESLEKLRAVVFLICLTLAACGIARAQQQPFAGDGQLSAVAQALAKNEQLLQITTNENERFYLLTRMTTGAFAAGETEKAKTYANTLLSQAESMQKDWNYGNAVHVGNFVLGRIALVEDDLEKARHYLLESGKTPGSPQLNSFGPNMLLAKELLEKGERGVVIEYFDLCARFWRMEDGRLDAWKALALEGEIPDFNANLRYQL